MVRLTTQQLVTLIVAVIALALLVLLIFKLGVPQQANQTVNQTADVMEEMLWSK